MLNSYSGTLFQLCCTANCGNRCRERPHQACIKPYVTVFKFNPHLIFLLLQFLEGGTELKKVIIEGNKITQLLMFYTCVSSRQMWSPQCHVAVFLWTRCPDGAHQLVWDAVPPDTRQRVPQSGASAARVPAGVRLLDGGEQAPWNSSPPQGTHSLPSPLHTLTYTRAKAVIDCLGCILRDWMMCTPSVASRFHALLNALVR